MEEEEDAEAAMASFLSSFPSSASHITWRLTASNHHKPTQISRSCRVISAQVCVSVNL